MTNITFNPQYLMKDQKPWFPIMGEMHYSRYPKAYWKESLYKMKAGGIDVVSSYVFWIHHEEIEDEYDFTGNKSLREFVQAIQEVGLSMMLRIGPWCHGECRNGGFPDWLFHKGFEPRTNNETYFAYVRQFYKTIYQQVKGLLHKDQGPIIGVQIENECGHCGGPHGEDGEEHMRRLTTIAKEVGFEVPLYTATGWGGAVTGGLLPVMGGYCEAPWDQRLTEIEPSGNYIFTKERNDHNIGSDYGFGTGITYDLTKFPYLTAELGGGLQVTKHRRPIAHSKDIGAMSLVKLGSGVNLLGYYMYHGGTNPVGKCSTLQESKETGYPNDLPILNYDFNAPIREYGQISETFKEIKLLAMFIKDFGEEFCKTELYLPPENPLYQTDFQHLRTSIRYHMNSGYVFLNNYQRRYEMAKHQGVELKVSHLEEEIRFPKIDVKDQDYAFYPFNMQLGKYKLKTALASPLCLLDNQEKTYVFYTNGDPCYEIEGVKGEIQGVRILTLSREQAKNAYKVKLEQEYIIISDSLILDTADELMVIGRKKPRLLVYPKLSNVPQGFHLVGAEKEFAVYEQDFEVREDAPYVSYRLLLPDDSEKSSLSTDTVDYELMIEYPEGNSNRNDAFLQINYAGDSAKLYLDDEMVADHFYTGQTWEIGLKRFAYPSKLTLRIDPLYENSKVFLEIRPKFTYGVAAALVTAQLETEYIVYVLK